MKHENTKATNFKKWEAKELTPEEKFAKLYDDFKTSVIRSGILRECRKREYYIKPSQVRRMKIAEQKMKNKQNKKRKSKGY